ncbi:MAG: hypothetical protein WBA15_03655 [Mesorhizobium sp.]
MTTGRERFIRQIEDAAQRVEIMPRDEIAALFRRAALRLRNADGLGLDPAIEEKFEEVCRLTGTAREELASAIIGDWLVATGYFPFHETDEESETDGAA